MTADIANSTTNAAGAAVAFPSNPFVGLRPFNSGEALLFFGRGEQTVELLRRLHRDHFIAVVGSSGCGKSSLVRAGLIPKLRAGFLTEDRDQWLVAVMKPGDAPLRNLAAALIEAIPAGGDVENCAEAIRDGGAHAVIEQLSPSLAHSDANLLLLVDQFEEIFRFGFETGKPEQQAEAEDFVSIMLALAEQRRLPVYVVMTMRSDFLGDCDHFHGLPEAMNRSQYLVPRLTRQQRRQAIEGPILLFGASISPRLLDRVLNDVGDKSDQLPVMQHALMRAYEQWQRSGDPQIDVIHYEAIGTIKDALSNDANGVLETLSRREKEIAMRMFQSLTKIDGYKRRTRRPVKFDKLMAITGSNRQTLRDIIIRFQADGRSFILPEAEKIDDNSTIDISHESLIRQWKTLRDWTDIEAQSWELYQELSKIARRFRDGKLNGLSTLDLKDYRKWREEISPNGAWISLYEIDRQSEFNPDVNLKRSAVAWWSKSYKQPQRHPLFTGRFLTGRSEFEAVMNFLSLWWRLYRVQLWGLRIIQLIVWSVLLIIIIFGPVSTYMERVKNREKGNQEAQRSEEDRLNNEGFEHFLNGDFDAAIQKYNVIISMNKNHLSAYFYRGISYARKGDADKARADFQKVLRQTSDENTKEITERFLQRLPRAIEK